MSIYVYSGTADDFDCMGLVGELTPIECTHEEIAGGMSEIMLVHPIDEIGRWQALVRGNILRAPIPVRTTPEIDMSSPSSPKRVTSVEIWTVADGASKADRYLMSKPTGGSKKKLLPPGTLVTVVERGVTRHKVKCQWGTGYIAVVALTHTVQQSVPNTNVGIEQAQPPWRVTDQLFRIYRVLKDFDFVTVYARHIFYDLLTNVTSYTATTCSAGRDFKNTWLLRYADIYFYVVICNACCTYM